MLLFLSLALSDTRTLFPNEHTAEGQPLFSSIFVLNNDMIFFRFQFFRPLLKVFTIHAHGSRTAAGCVHSRTEPLLAHTNFRFLCLPHSFFCSNRFRPSVQGRRYETDNVWVSGGGASRHCAVLCYKIQCRTVLSAAFVSFCNFFSTYFFSFSINIIYRYGHKKKEATNSTWNL